MSEDIFALVMQRPDNFHMLDSRQQWEIDKNLGILDWDGEMTPAQREKYMARFGTWTHK